MLVTTKGDDMAYVRKKKIRGGNGKTYTYHQLVRGYREDGKVKQEVVAHLGRHETPEAALAYWQEQAQRWRQNARDHMRGAQLIRDRAVRASYNNRARYWCLPREGTPLPDEPVVFHGFAPRGWFYHRGSADDAEQEAQEYLAKAERLDERVAHLRSVL
jgi:hypothetical protein